MTRFVVGSVLLALVELIGFATYTATHRIEVGVVAVRPNWGGSYGSSVLIRAPVSRSRSRVPRTHSTSALRDNGARANLNASVRGIKPITVATGTIVASGTVLHHGRGTATAEGRLGAADTGALLAHSPSTLLVLS